MSKSPLRREPEWLISLGALLLGAVATEMGRVSYFLSLAWWKQLMDGEQIGPVIVIAWLVLAVLLGYAYQRGAVQFGRRLWASRRFDLLVLGVIGGWMAFLLDTPLENFHKDVAGLNPYWAPAVLGVLTVILLAKVLGGDLRRKTPEDTQIYFLSDDEVTAPEHDFLGVRQRAEDFADMVLASSAASGLVFGVEGPWGVGKTSFLNIAAGRWADVAKDRVIVVRFEPLRYASEPELAERLIQMICATIQNQVFAPEFITAAARYSRMLKGETEFSVFGVKLSMAASPETLDDLLQAIDDVLKKIGRRLIVVVDDLDRLEPALVNSVLFTVRKAFHLKRAAYILCYDDEHLLAGNEEGAQAREFLEKFITAKLSVFSNLDLVRDFLRGRWVDASTQWRTFPDALDNVGIILREAGDLLSGKNAPKYVPLLGALRKLAIINKLLKIDTQEKLR